MLSRSLITAVCAGALVLMTFPAQAAHHHTDRLSKRVACDGALIHYKTPRYLSGQSSTEMLVQAEAMRGTRQPTPMRLVLETRHEDLHATVAPSSAHADRWATFNTRKYTRLTQFTLAAQLVKTHGRCDPKWSATLYY